MGNRPLDTDNLIEVSDVAKRGEVYYDLRYLSEREKWGFRRESFDALSLEENALREYISKDGDVVLSVQDPKDSSFYRGRSDSENKGLVFTNRKLREHLDKLGYEDVDNFALIPVAREEDREYFIVDPWGDREMSPLLEERMEDAFQDEA
jgi:hypothetical protein